MEIISNIALISINETLIFQVISFLIFLFIINRIMFRPLRNVMDERKNYIKNIQSDIVSAENKFESLTDQIKEQESAVKKEAFEIKDKLEKSSSQQAAEILASTKQEIAVLKEKAQKQVDAQVSEARKYLKKESEALASNIIERVLNRSLNP